MTDVQEREPSSDSGVALSTMTTPGAQKIVSIRDPNCWRFYLLDETRKSEIGPPSLSYCVEGGEPKFIAAPFPWSKAWFNDNMTQIIRDAHAEASGDKHRIMPLLASRIEEQCPQITYEFRDKTTWSYRMGAALHDAAEVLEDIKGTVSSIEVGLTSCCRREKRSGGKTHYEEDVSQATAAPHTREQRDDVLANSTQYAGISSEGEGSQTTLVHRHAATAASSEASAASNSI